MTRHNEILFNPLGGAQSVGGSCYYLKLGEENILLDCGLGIKHGVYQGPNLYSLLENDCIKSFSQLTRLFVSHAHLDHIGYLPTLYRDVPSINTYMTDITCTLSDLQLKYENKLSRKRRSCSIKKNELLLKERCLPVSFQQKIPIGNFHATFFPAGHIPGAMMTLLNYKGRNILYTGDYSFEDTTLTPAASFPYGTDVDVLIICGLHAKRPYHNRRENNLERIGSNVIEKLNYGESVYCGVRQLSKGLELLSYLNTVIPNDIPIFVDKEVMKVVQAMEQVNIPILQENNHLQHLPNRYWRDGYYSAMDYPAGNQPKIFIGNSKRQDFLQEYHYMDCDFTLHDDFQELTQFIRKINPRTAIMVHCAPADSYANETVEQQLMMDAHCRTQFIFPEPGEVLVL